MGTRPVAAVRALFFGSAASIVASCLAPAVLGADGYANVNGTTTGGSGAPVVCTTLSQLTSAASDDVSRVVHISGTINLGSSNFRVGSNKTIIGQGSGSGFSGNLQCRLENNIVLQNLNFTNPNSVGDGDGLTLYGATHVWVDNCSFTQCGDGSLDVTHGADWITVSWCKFQYTSNTGHNFVNLIGHSDNNAGEDTGKLHVTFHHNWWATLCVERMPRMRFARVHSYNNYFNCSGNNQCIRASIQSQALAENNYFENINRPYEKFASSSSTGSQVGLIRAVGNTTVNCTNVQSFSDSVFAPPYGYSLESPSTARTAIIASAGTGGGGGGGTTTTLQAESGSIGGGTTIDNNNAGFMGSGFANFPVAGGFLQLNNVNGGAGGSSTVTVRYANGATGARTGARIVNGSAQSITFNPTGSWTAWNTTSFTVNLNSGTGNTIRFESNGQDLGNIDQITVTAP
jgi:pectate lyase